jgi:hypothetical protein
MHPGGIPPPPPYPLAGYGVSDAFVAVPTNVHAGPPPQHQFPLHSVLPQFHPPPLQGHVYFPTPPQVPVSSPFVAPWQLQAQHFQSVPYFGSHAEWQPQLSAPPQQGYYVATGAHMLPPPPPVPQADTLRGHVLMPRPCSTGPHRTSPIRDDPAASTGGCR